MKCAHDDLADVRFRRHQPAELRSRDAHQAAVGGGASVHQDLAIVEEIELAGELAIALHREDPGAAAFVQLEDLDASLEDQEEVDAALAALEEQRPGGDALLDAEGGGARGLLGREPRKDLGFAFVGISAVGRVGELGARHRRRRAWLRDPRSSITSST